MNQRSPHQVVLAHIARGPAFLARGLIQLYRHTLSALIGLECRHLPTCSSYADEAIGRFGLWAGGWMTLARLGRCHPFGTSGLDFVPTSLPVHARWYLPWRYGRWRGTNDAIAPEPPSRV
jgi:putative membrane protein insertion efficiency factor